MKFEYKYPNALAGDRFEFEYSHVTKTPKLAPCQWCNAYTKWFDILFQVNVCSEECNSTMWHQYKTDQKTQGTYENFEEHFKKVKEELKLGSKNKEIWKDIIIVVRDQLAYFKDCIESIRKNSTNYHLYIWDNGSQKETQDYINQLIVECTFNDNHDYHITTIRSEANTGFIHPNNELIALGENPYIILLNSDTKVFENWDNTMITYLLENPETAQVGFWGGHLDSTGRGFGGSNGENIDYVPGWCFCISRETYNQFGLFSNNLKFAYCEDSDFSLRLQEAGKKIYALHTPLVHHYQNVTVKEVGKEGFVDLSATFDYNHNYIKERWKNYLLNDRAILRKEKGK